MEKDKNCPARRKKNVLGALRMSILLLASRKKMQRVNQARDKM